MKKTRVRQLKKRVHGHESFVAVALAVVAVCTLAGSDAFFAVPDSPRIAHANTSANPYQPVNGGTYVPPSYYGIPPTMQNGYVYPSLSSSTRSLPRAAVQRRLKNARRSADKIQKQLMQAEDTIDALQRKIDASPGRTHDALESLMLELTDSYARLNKRFADLQTQIASYELLLDPSKDMSR